MSSDDFRFGQCSGRPMGKCLTVRPRAEVKCAFTLVEMLVATAVFVVLITLLLSMVSHAMHLWQRTEGQKERQQIARQVFEMIGRDLEGAIWPVPSSATNSFQFLVDPGFPEYENPSAAFWQTVSSGDTSNGDVSEVGYFVRWVSDSNGVHSELRRLWITASNAGVFTSPESWLTENILQTNAPGSEDTSQKGLLAGNVLGIWFTLYNKTNGVISSPYDSRAALTDRPASAEVSLALADSRTVKRIKNKEDVTSYYSATNAQGFLAELTDSHPEFKEGVQVFTTRVNFGVAP